MDGNGVVVKSQRIVEGAAASSSGNFGALYDDIIWLLAVYNLK